MSNTYKNGRTPSLNDPAIGRGPTGAILVGKVSGTPPSFVIQLPTPVGSSFAHLDAGNFYHAEDALKAIEPPPLTPPATPTP